MKVFERNFVYGVSSGDTEINVTTTNHTLLAAQRQNLILEILEREGAVRTSELQELLKVSLVTIRADLRELELRGTLELIRGGAISREPAREPELVVTERSVLNVEKKRRIGEYAATLVKDGQTIIVDAGTTTIEVFHALAPTLEYVKIVTPALNIATAASQLENVEVVMLGGIVRPLTQSIIGSPALQALSFINADLTFLASGGVTSRRGVTTSNLMEAEVKRAMAQCATQVVLVADSSKFGTRLSFTVAPLTDIDLIITDDALPDEMVTELENAGPQVIRV